MENKKINIAELLKNCPKGMELDCAMLENVVFDHIYEGIYPIRIRKKDGSLEMLTENGCFHLSKDAKCVIFPKGKTTWEGFVPPYVKDGHPKTYKECCDILGLDTMANDAQGYKSDLIIRLQELIICRDAYWKVYSEQMRLDCPWYPDYEIDENGFGTVKFCIKNKVGKIMKIETYETNTILAFPTAEMRNAFYENFREDIERCSELL